MSNDIQMIKVKDADINLAMQAGSKTETARRKVNRGETSIWGITVINIVDHIDIEKMDVGDTSKDNLKVAGDLVREELARIIQANAEIPEQGTSVSGSSIELKNDDGTYKFRSWDQTSAMWKYCGDIAKIIVHGLVDQLNPNDTEVMPRNAALKMCKANSSVMDNIVRLTDDLQGWLDKVENRADSIQAQEQVDSLMVNNIEPLTEALGLVRKLDRIAGAVEGTPDSEALKTALLAMATKHWS